MKNLNISPVGPIRLAGFLLALILCGTGIGHAKLPPAPAIWDGNDGLQPPLSLRFSHYLATPAEPGPNPFHIIWRIEEEWVTSDGTRRVNIERVRLETRNWAARFIQSNLASGNLAFLANHKKWDKKAVLGSRSLTISAPILGSNRIWFVLEKEFIDFEYFHPNTPPKALEWRQAAIQVGRSIIARIRAQNECGEHEKDADEDSNDHHRDD